MLQGQEIIYHLLSEKQLEAKKSQQALTALADALNIGLVSLKDGLPKPLSSSTEPLLKNFGGMAVLNKLKKRLQKGKTVVLKNEEAECAIQCTPVKYFKNNLELVVIQDISESFKAAKRLKQQERLAILGKLTAQMAHQIKTPLAILAGQAQMLAKKLGKDHELYLRAISIYEEAQELAEQINGITAFYKAQQPNFIEFSIKKLFDDLKRSLSRYDANCDIVFHTTSDLKLKTDYMMLKSLIFLLIQNSLAPETGATKVEVFAESSGDFVKILIKDNGKGIPPEARKEIFEPFYSTREDGLGLGLFLASELANKLGARLELEDSREGEGACFSLQFEKPD